MIDRDNGRIPFTADELNNLLESGLRQMRVAATGVLPNGRFLNERAADRLSRNGMNDAEKALRLASKQRIKLDKDLSLKVFTRGVHCTLYNIDYRALERNPELALI